MFAAGHLPQQSRHLAVGAMGALAAVFGLFAFDEQRHVLGEKIARRTYLEGHMVLTLFVGTAY